MPLTNNTFKKIALAVFIIIAGLAIWLASNPKPPVMPFPGVTILPKPLTLSDFQLTSHKGETFTNEGLEDKWSIMFFGFTHCPDICPTTLAMLNKFYKTPDINSPDLQIIFVSADPIRDTPQRLADHVNYYNKEFIGITAPSVDVIKKFGEEVGVIFDYETPDHELITDLSTLTPDSKYNVEHNASIFIIDPKARLVADILPPHTTARLSETYQLVKEYY